MGMKFVPEMHDIGKLIEGGWCHLTTDGESLRVHIEKGPSFDNLDWVVLNLEKLPFDNATWLAIVYHMDRTTEWVRDLSEPLPKDITIGIEDRVRLFLTIIADHLAATTGRALGKEEKRVGAEEAEVHRLWNPGFADALEAEPGIKPVPIANDEALRKAIELLKNETDWGGYLEEYGPSMQICAEDKDAARRVTSLLSHSELLGKFYRVLEGAVELLDDPPRLALKGLAGTEVTKVSEAEACWVGRLVRAVVKFHQQPVRPGDLGVFERLGKCHEAFGRVYPDNLLFASTDTLWLFLPGQDGPPLNEVLKGYTQAGFYVECIVHQAALEDLTIRFEAKDFAGEQKWLKGEVAKKQQALANEQNRLAIVAGRLARATTPEKQEAQRRVIDDAQKAVQRLQVEISESQGRLKWLPYRQSVFKLMDCAFYPKDIFDTLSFDPHMCEICQMRPGKEMRFGTATDYLCPLCAGIRKGGFSQRELSSWLERGQGNVLWVKTNLDPERLEATLTDLFAAYVDKLKLEAGKQVGIKAALRLPALLRDFVGDYRALLEEIDAEVERVAGERKWMAALAEDAWVLSIQDGGQVYGLLKRYCELLAERFPVFWSGPDMGGQVTMPNPPIRLGVSIGSAKYPFYQHWRYVSAPPAPVSVWVVGREPLEVGLVGLKALLTVNFSVREARQGRTHLHKLASIERRSGSRGLVQAIFLSELRDPRRSKLPRILEEFRNPVESGLLGMGQILAYEKITTFGRRGR